MSDTARLDAKTDRPDRAPISAHPAFPAIVAMWFAALLGIGSMVLPVAIFERLFEATGIASLVPAAQAPLGVTARILIALVAASGGIAAGLMVARKVVAASLPQRPVSRRAVALGAATDARPADTKRRPISAHAELGEGGIDASAPAAVDADGKGARRRALSVTDENARSDFLEYAPLPGHFDAPTPDFETSAEPADDPALDLAEFAPVEDATGDGFGSSALGGMPAAPARPFDAEPALARQVFQPLVEGSAADTDDAAAVTAPIETASAGSSAPRTLAELGLTALVERFARALEQHRADVAAAADSQDLQPIDLSGILARPHASASAPKAPEPFAPAAFDEPQAAPVPNGFAADPAQIPAALRPFALDVDHSEDEDDAMPVLDLGAMLSRSPKRFSAPAAPEPAQAFDEVTDETGDPEDEGYSSLLAMKSPFGLPRESVRIEDEPQSDDDEIEPIVVFPGQATRRAAPATDGPARDAGAATFRPFDAPTDRIAAFSAKTPEADAPNANRRPGGDTERALREALEKLQRMSGAA